MDRDLSRAGAYALLHVTVFLWGFTAILGRLISISAIPLVWYRLVVATSVLAGVVWWRGLSFRITAGDAVRYGITGALIGLHWICFFGAIKVAGVATAVLCLATVTFFTALIEPAMFRRRIAMHELAIGAVVVAGVGLITTMEIAARPLGIVLGIGAAVFAAAFGCMNATLSRRDRGERVMLFEFVAALVTVTATYAVWPDTFIVPWRLDLRDVVLIAILGVACTVWTQLWALRVLRVLSPFTVAVSVNLEPVYSLVMVIAFFPAAESPSWRFYVGAAVLLALVALNAWLKRQPSAVARESASARASESVSFTTEP